VPALPVPAVNALKSMELTLSAPPKSSQHSTAINWSTPGQMPVLITADTPAALWTRRQRSGSGKCERRRHLMVSRKASVHVLQCLGGNKSTSDDAVQSSVQLWWLRLRCWVEAHISPRLGRQCLGHFCNLHQSAIGERPLQVSHDVVCRGWQAAVIT
jgi:hypothetical protein